jgi:hypothetical protein
MKVQANVENLTTWVPDWFPLKVLLLRFYAAGVEPIEPNHFESTMNIVQYGFIGVIKGAVEIGDVGVKAALALAECKRFGIKIFLWKHNMKWRPYY